MSGWKVIVPDNVHNTQLDCAVFATQPEAQQAAVVVRETFDCLAAVIETVNEPNATYAEWDRAGGRVKQC